MTPAPRMVVVGLHPAVDRTIEIPLLRAGGMIRGRQALIEPAGKGMNLARDLAALGQPVTALGFLGREDAVFFLSALPEELVAPRFVTVPGAARVNITLIEEKTRRDTHITSGALEVRRKDVAAFARTLRDNVRRGDWVAFTGSRPRGFSEADFLRALRACNRQGARLCVDTGGDLLRKVLAFRPWAIKPNRSELQDLVDRPLRTLPRVLAAARSLLDRCPNVVVSLGGEGALLVTPGGAWLGIETGRAPVAHTVGCGDALFAGFLHASGRGLAGAEAIRHAVACGSACVRTHSACFASAREPARLLPRIRVTPVG